MALLAGCGGGSGYTYHMQQASAARLNAQPEQIEIIEESIGVGIVRWRIRYMGVEYSCWDYCKATATPGVSDCVPHPLSTQCTSGS